jgi:hypothetical protein
VKYATLVLAASLTGTVIAACSATSAPTPSTTTGSEGSGGASTVTVTATGASSAVTGSATTSAAGTGGASTTTTTGGTTAQGSTGAVGTGGAPEPVDGGPIDFDGGWQIPDSGMQPPLLGDGGTGILIGPGADASSPGKFGGPDGAGSKPSIVYPPTGVVVPPNMNSLEVHFLPAAGQTLFEITFHAPTTTLTVYTGCTALNGGCVFTPDKTFWSNLVAYARGTVPVTYTIKGVNGQSPGVVGTSAQRTIAFGQQNLSGGIYYWNTGGVIQRYDFGFPSAPAQQYLTAANVGAFACVGCHALSRDGKRIAVGADIPAPAGYKILDVVSKTPVSGQNGPLTGGANFFSYSPDSKYLLSSDGAQIIWKSLITGDIYAPSVANPGTMPDWAPSGLQMVYAKPGAPVFFPNPGVSSASLVKMHFNGTGWDNATTVVPFTGQNNYYPSFSPDGDWIVFNRSPSNADSFANASPDPDAGTSPDGELWVVSEKGGAPIRLDVASTPGASSWPKWSPLLQDYYAGKILWLTFSSARAYGLRLAQGARTQLWMAGFDLGKAALGQDPSLPAFWMPFQDINGGNHIAQWTTTVPRKPCTQTADCDPGETCKAMFCTP